MGKEKKNSKDKKQKKKMKLWLKILLWILAIFIIGSIAFMVIQKDMFFYPSFDNESNTWLHNQSSFEEITITTVDEDAVSSSLNMNTSTLSGWIKFNRPKTEKAPLVIYFGGNAQSSANTMRAFEVDGKFSSTFKGYNFMYVDYPGYGLSTGEPSDKSLFDAGIKTYDYAKMQKYVDKDNIIIVGYSIGTGVATYVTSKENPKGLILIAPYDKGLSLYNGAINSFYGPMKSYARYKFNSSKEADKILCNSLIITSRDDEVIDYKLALKLADRFEVEPELVILEGVMHNQYFNRKAALDKIQEYLTNNLPEEMLDGDGEMVEPEEEEQEETRVKTRKGIVKPRVVY